MKRIFLLLATIGLFAVQSCTTNDNETLPPDNDTISEVYEIKNKNFSIDNNGDFSYSEQLNPNIFASDVLLIYRLAGTLNPTTPIWQPIPRTFYLTNGRELDYDFDFTKVDFKIFVRGNFPVSTEPSYLSNQTFRIVIVPGAFSNKSSVYKTLSYEEAIAKYNIDDTKVISIN